MGWLSRQEEARLYREEQLATGVKIYVLGSRSKEKLNAMKNYEIEEGNCNTLGVTS